MPYKDTALFGKAALLDKIRLTRKRWWQKSFSQMGEDIVLRHIFEGCSLGYYVDVGCFHPKKYSNTEALYEAGWKGVNIDISQRKIALFDFARPRDRNIFSAVADRAGTLEAYVFDGGSALDTTDKETAEAWVKKFGKAYNTVQVPCNTLSEILNACDVPHVDYLNIDVEGAEIAVLKGMDFQEHQPKCISIEIHGNLEAILSEVVPLRWTVWQRS